MMANEISTATRGRVRNFRDLQVWQNGRRIVIDVYKVTTSFPAAERYGLVAQMRRSAVSVPSNISEGFCRAHQREYRRFLFIALGSCAELETQVELSTDLGFIDLKQRDRLLEALRHEARMLTNLVKRVSSKADRRPTTDDRRLTTDDRAQCGTRTVPSAAVLRPHASVAV
jgi:four helix bundle protein